jgi:polysaccharide pyruvyl transferase WcaK-like protein
MLFPDARGFLSGAFRGGFKPVRSYCSLKCAQKICGREPNSLNLLKKVQVLKRLATIT